MKFRVRYAKEPLHWLHRMIGMELDGPALFVADLDQEATDWSSNEINRLGLSDHAHVVDDLGNVYGVDEERNNVCALEFSLFLQNL
jgi:hypothetical protein